MLSLLLLQIFCSAAAEEGGGGRGGADGLIAKTAFKSAYIKPLFVP
jgi:hypothetical protein